MEFITDILEVLVPSVVVFLTAYYTLRQLIQRELILKKTDLKSVTSKEVMILRLQAYERLILFLERISPQNLVLRVDKGVKSASDFHLELLSTIRAEFDHNISQQLYISSEAWGVLISAKEETVKFINICREQLPENETALGLSKQILTRSIGTIAPTVKAIDFIKSEAQRLF